MLHKRASITTVLFLAAIIPLLALLIWLSGYQPPDRDSAASGQNRQSDRTGTLLPSKTANHGNTQNRLIRLKQTVEVSSNGKTLFHIPAGSLISAVRHATGTALLLATNRNLSIPATAAAQQISPQSTESTKRYQSPLSVLRGLQRAAQSGSSLHSYVTDPLLVIPRSGPGPVTLTRLDLQMLKHTTPFRKKFAGPPWNLTHLYARIRPLPFNTRPKTNRSTGTFLWPSSERYGLQLEFTRASRRQGWLIRKIIWRELLPSDLQ